MPVLNAVRGWRLLGGSGVAASSRGRGRPPVPRDERRAVRNVWYSSNDTRERLAAYAEREGLSLSTATEHLIESALAEGGLG